MALVIDDRVRETTTVTGTSDATLLGAVTGFQAFTVIGNGNTTYYTISDQSGNNWEVGLGTFSSVGPTLARTTVLSSSAGGAKVSFPAGTKDVFVTYPSEKAVYLDESGNVQPNLGAAVFSAGTVSAPSITFTGDTNTGIYSPAADTIAFSEGGVESMRIDTSGNVLIGTSTGTTSFGRTLNLYTNANTGSVASNAYLLVQSVNRNSVVELAGSASSTNALNFSTTPGTSVAGIVSNIADQNLFFRTGGTTERMRITSGGNVCIGTTEALSTDADRRYLAIRGVGTGTGTGIGVLQLQTNSAGSTSPNCGNIEWNLPDNTSSLSTRVAYISVGIEGVAANNYGSSMQFATKTDGASSAGVERMRITSAGFVGIGTSSPITKLNIYDASLASVLVQSEGTVNVIVNRASTDAVGSALAMRKARGTIASPLAVASGDTSGQLLYQVFGGTNTRNIAGIFGIVDTYTSDTDISGYLTFSTVPAGTNSVTERMRIASTGNVSIGTTLSVARLSVLAPSTTDSTTIDLRGFRSFIPETYGATSLVAVSNGTRGAHDFGAIRFEQNPAIADGGGALFRMFCAGNSSSFPTSAEFLRATSLNNSGTDNIQFRTQDVERMRIDGAGNVGIGTSSPTASTGFTVLHINNAATGGQLHLTGGGSGAAVGDGSLFTHIAAELYINNQESGPTLFFNNGSERMRITSAGDVGINTTTMDGRFNVGGTSNPAIYSASTGGIKVAMSAVDGLGAGFFGTSTNHPQGFYTNNAERMRITAVGAVGIGTSSPNSQLQVIGRIVGTQNMAGGGGAGLSTFAAGTAQGQLAGVSFYPTFVGTADNGQRRAADMWAGFNGGNWNTQYLAFGVGFVGNDVQDVTPERMRIDSGGNLLIGTTAGSDFRLRVTRSGNFGIAVLTNADTSGITYDQFQVTVGQAGASTYFFTRMYASAGASSQFGVRGDGVIFAQNTTVQSISDARTKENVVDSIDGLDVVNALRPVRFDFKEGFGNEKKNQLGFIAQEIEQVFPDAVDIWGESDDPEDPYKSVGTTALIPVLVKAIQELKAELDSVKAELQTLKGN